MRSHSVTNSLVTRVTLCQLIHTVIFNHLAEENNECQEVVKVSEKMLSKCIKGKILTSTIFSSRDKQIVIISTTNLVLWIRSWKRDQFCSKLDLQCLPSGINSFKYFMQHYSDLKHWYTAVTVGTSGRAYWLQSLCIAKINYGHVLFNNRYKIFFSSRTDPVTISQSEGLYCVV